MRWLCVVCWSVQRMTILIVCSQYPPQQGGGGTHTFYLASELARCGCKVHVLTSKVDGWPLDRKVGPSLWIHRVNFGPKWALSSFEPLKAGLDLCNGLGPDVVHGQHLQGANVAIRLKAAFGIPAVITLHKTPKLNAVGDRVRVDPLYSELRFLASTGLCDCFVAGSNAFRDELLEIAGAVLSPHKVRLIYHGVSYNWLTSRAFRAAQRPSDVGLNLRPDEELIICPARIDRRKNLPLFVSAAAALARRLPEKRFKFLITGEAQDREERRHLCELQAQASHLGIHRSLIFKSFDFNSLPAVFRFSKACVLPSFKEGLGLVLLEALALRVPTVATRTKGIEEVIRADGEGALLFEIGEESDLVRQLVRVITDPKLVCQLKQNGRRLVEGVFSGKRMALQHLSLYATLAGQDVPTAAV